ncbi:hypothetical protein OS493_005530 [Desmophyllum pertusum]|uniref:trimethyllysine dioxygenase n=1 Tax=Desmophyllum pertusum TaxID=174260 RepID=A0A9W9YV55_9CNID|nr:hypothetical protein OS493_005530 [Desmophyllum pertusum]
MASHLRAPLRAGVTSLLRVPFRVEAVSHCRDFLKITWKDGAKSEFPNIWLRSSIRDEQFFDAGSCLYRLEKYLAFVSKDSSLLSAEYHEGNDFLKVQWPEHSTTFDLSWLRAQDTTHHDNAPQVVTWTADSILDNFFDYSRIVEDMESWMMCLRKYGVAYMRGVPPNEEGLKGVLHTIGKIRQRYHPTDITLLIADHKLAEENDRDVYGFGTLAPHTDHGYYLSQGKVACLLGSRYNAPVQDTVNFFIDNVKVIEDIREEDPEAFELLSTVPIRAARRRLTVQEECRPSEVAMYQVDIHLQRPLIYFDENDGHYKLRFSTKQAGFELSSDKSPSKMLKYYKAYELLRSKVYDPKYQQRIVVKEGMAALYDNSRVCHGRGPIHQTTQRTILAADVVDQVWYSRCRLMLGKKSGLEDRWLFGCSLKALDLLSDRYEK